MVAGGGVTTDRDRAKWRTFEVIQDGLDSIARRESNEGEDWGPEDAARELTEEVLRGITVGDVPLRDPSADHLAGIVDGLRELADLIESGEP